MVWEIDIRWGVGELTKLLDVMEKAIEGNVSQRYAAYEEYEQTPIEPGTLFIDAFGKLELLRDAFITAAGHYRLWAYGGFITTALAWLGDQLLFITNTPAHSSYAVFSERLGETVERGREPSLSGMLVEWPLDAGLKDRLELWVTLRNRFVHSLGIVADEGERNGLAGKLGIHFDTDARMQLMPSDCRALLGDVEAAGVAVASQVVDE